MYSVREAKTRLSDTAVRELIGNGAYTMTVLTLLKEVGVGKVKAGVLDRNAG